MSFPFADVERAIDGLRSKLKCTVHARLQDEFDAGLHPNLLAYQKRQSGGSRVPVLEKYLVGATSYLHQPSNYYDIFGAGRCVILVQLLDSALDVLQQKQCKGLPPRIARLVRVVDPDEFDSTAFELITAARYALVSAVERVGFIDERPPKRTPDFVMTRGGVDSFVECKKVVRVRDFSVATRKTVRELLNGVISSFLRKGDSVLAEVSFHCDPKSVSESSLFEVCQAALNDHTTIITSQFTVKAKHLPKFDSKGCTLYPSAHFLWARYGHRVRSEWFGIVHNLVGKRFKRVNLPEHLRGGMSTWLKSVEWDAAIKWKINAEDIVGKYQRFPFSGLFDDGLEQINNAGPDSTVHVWLETDYFIGGRRDVLLDFFRRLSAKTQRNVGWVVFNETLLDISPKGRFDLIEYAHMIQGPTATTPHPLVSGVFGLPSPMRTIGEFGVGHELPDIDE